MIERRWQAGSDGKVLHVFHRKGRELGFWRPTWLNACHKAGLGHRWFHSLRRNAARNMSLKGIPQKVIMSIMGHKTRGMFDRYNIATEADQRAYAARLFGE
ncbi:MAG: tyrosine-type recombinase/integrase [Candidatus Tectomicrobia bacterium]|nr:tyrosine-type recombinase/integrase [Candidatus Tectomicrobia bacterium]